MNLYDKNVVWTQIWYYVEPNLSNLNLDKFDKLSFRLKFEFLHWIFLNNLLLWIITIFSINHLFIRHTYTLLYTYTTLQIRFTTHIMFIYLQNIHFCIHFTALHYFSCASLKDNKIFGINYGPSILFLIKNPCAL